MLFFKFGICIVKAYDKLVNQFKELYAVELIKELDNNTFNHNHCSASLEVGDTKICLGTGRQTNLKITC